MYLDSTGCWFLLPLLAWQVTDYMEKYLGKNPIPADVRQDNFLIPFSSQYLRTWVLILLPFPALVFFGFFAWPVPLTSLAGLEVQLFPQCQHVGMHHFKEAAPTLLCSISCPLWHCQTPIRNLCAWWVLLPSPSQKEYFNFTAWISFVNPSPPALRVFFFFPVSKKMQTAGYVWLISSRQICSFIMFKEPSFPLGILRISDLE